MVNRIEDNFETGLFSDSWTYQATNGGKLLVHGDAALNGSYGMKLIVDSTTNIGTSLESANADKRFRCRFYKDINTLTMAEADNISILSLANAAWGTVLNVSITKVGATYTLQVYDATDGAWTKYVDGLVFTDAEHWFEIDWKAATSSGANNGYFTIWKDTLDTPIASITGIDSDTESISNIMWGIAGIPATTSGIFYQDSFVSNNDGSAIGAYVAPTGFTLGFNMSWDANTSWIDSEFDAMLAAGFTDFRIAAPDYQNTTNLAIAKAAVIRAIAKGAIVTWGISSNSFNNAAYTITATNWPTFRTAILNAASWSQANGVYEFQLGNEEEWHVDGTTMTIAQIISNLKSTATEVQAIFTRGNVSYTFSFNFVSNWVTAGKGDIDLLGMNVYMESGQAHYDEPWEAAIDSFAAAFPTGYITEFGPCTDGLAYYSADEAVQAVAVREMVDYIEASGITRAVFFQFISDSFGARNWNDTYKLLWYELLNNDNPESPPIPDYTGYLGYTSGNYAALPADDTNLETTYTAQKIIDVGISDNVRVAQAGLSEFIIHQFKDHVGDNTSCILEWEGQTTQAPSTSTVYLQIYNRDTTDWDAIDSDNSSAANTDFTLSGTVASLTNYKDVNLVISCRIYQEAV